MIWEWALDMTEKSTERVRKWRNMNQERMRELSRKSSAAYRDRHKDDPEFLEKHREQARRSAVKRYAEKRAEMTPEELEEHRKKKREEMRKYRAAKKAAAAEQQANESEKDR